MLNTPSREERGLTILPWEVILYKTLTDSTQQIDIDELYDEYSTFMDAQGLPVLPKKIILEYLDDLLTYRIGSNKISYKAYTDSLRWCTDNNRLYLPRIAPGQYIDPKRFKYVDWTKCMVVLLSQSIDLIAVGLLILSNPDFPLWLIVARCGAVMVLTNIAYILLPLINIAHFIPDQMLAIVFPSKYSSFYHAVFGIRVLIAGLVHTIAHILHVREVIRKCVDGCLRKDIHIVPRGDTTIVVSYAYFFSLYAYVTGFVLVGIFVLLLVALLLNRYGFLRYSMNQTIHKYCATIGIIFVIAHGGTHLVGFNFSYVLTLPFMVIYLWVHRHEVFFKKIRINRWVVTPNLIRLYLEDDDRFDKMLSSFGTVTVYVNHSKVSHLEWHPFTLSRGGKEATISMQRLGSWTKSFGNVLQMGPQVAQYIKIGSYKRSKFRFHHLYNVRYFFCAGIGITAFISAMTDTNNRAQAKYKSVLIWSVSNMDIVKEFIRHLNDLHHQMPRMKIEIYYSNSKRGLVYLSEQTQTRFRYLQSIIHGYNSMDIAFGAPSCAHCNFNRVDFMQVLSRAILTLKNGSDKNVGAFICGSNAYVANAIRYINLANANDNGIVFHVWPEST